MHTVKYHGIRRKAYGYAVSTDGRDQYYTADEYTFTAWITGEITPPPNVIAWINAPNGGRGDTFATDEKPTKLIRISRMNEDTQTTTPAETPADTPRQRNARTLQSHRRGRGRSVGDPSKLKHSREARSQIFREAVERYHYTLADAEAFGVSKVAFGRWISGKTAPELEVFVRLIELENEKDRQKKISGIADLEKLLARLKAQVAIDLLPRNNQE